MSLSALTLGSLIDTNLSGQNAVGPKRTSFSEAIASGVVSYVVGKSFTTHDTGTGTGGHGSDTGITGLITANMVSVALTAMSSQGPRAPDLMTAVMTAVVTHLATATLATTDSAVSTGSGTINIGTIAVVSADMAASILSALEADGAKGPRRQNLALAIATGICTEILAHGTGTVSISGGTGGGTTSGTGTGTIS